MKVQKAESEVKMYNIGICDDVNRVCSYIENIILEYTLKKNRKVNIEVWYTGESLCEYLKTGQEIDILFLDIELFQLNGIQVAEYIRNVLENRRMQIIYISGKDAYAQKLFKTQPMDFLVKPVAYAAFSTMMSRVCARLAMRIDDEIFIQNTQGGFKIKISDIFYVEVIKHYVIFHTPRGEVKMWGSLSDIEKRLPDKKFARCNNCYLINLKYVDKIEGNDLYIGGEVLAVSRGKKQEFMKKLLDYMER